MSAWHRRGGGCAAWQTGTSLQEKGRPDHGGPFSSPLGEQAGSVVCFSVVYLVFVTFVCRRAGGFTFFSGNEGVGFEMRLRAARWFSR